MTDTFKDALKLSNKTYFLEEMTKRKNEKKNLKMELRVLRDKARLADENLNRKDAQINELIKANKMLSENLKSGNQQIEQVLTQNKMATKKTL